ncbi:MAG: hypothetical protein PHN90_05510 [Methanothrix sp.]|jgi:hypothetical protein|nr:hypothetical protein [Methanothrix sp.]
MKPKTSLTLTAVLLAMAVGILAGCLDSGGNDFSTNTPLSVEVGTISDRSSHDVYFVLRDSEQDMTTSEGVAVITMFKGKFQDNDPDKVNEFVFSETYDVNREEFHRMDVLSNRDIERSLLAWKTKLPSEFDPNAFDVYKITIVFTPENANLRLVNQTYIVWG